MINRGILIIFVLLTFACEQDLAPISGCTDENATNFNPNAVTDNGNCIYFSTTPYTIEIPYGFPNMIIPKNNPMTVEGVNLGKKLFNDPILSADNSLACINCHNKSSSFSDPNQYSTGIDNIQGTRNASALVNIGWNSSFNWDGSAQSLEEQAFEPVTNPIEMHDTWQNVENKINANLEYKDLFLEAFNIDYIDSNHIVMAIAQFERTLISSDSKFDRYIRGEEQLTPSELSGYAIFNSEKGDCFHCHGSQMFMDNRFHNNGLDIEPFTDLGLGYVSENSNDNGKFRTPSLRNIEYTSPYMHDGRFISLEEVVNHYNSGGNYSSTVDPLMKKIGIGLQLTNEEKQDLVSFLKTLSDENFITK
ncbi:cytochrome c peroxidase [Flavobacteriales bacterium]|nr:cytochrome c peroxidase [Flavobacteriales bacterium]